MLRSLYVSTHLNTLCLSLFALRTRHSSSRRKTGASGTQTSASAPHLHPRMHMGPRACRTPFCPPPTFLSHSVGVTPLAHTCKRTDMGEWRHWRLRSRGRVSMQATRHESGILSLHTYVQYLQSKEQSSVPSRCIYTASLTRIARHAPTCQLLLPVSSPNSR